MNDRIYTGPTHYDAIMLAEAGEKMPFEHMTHAPITGGFVTNTGRYVSRWEAADIAARNKQGSTGGKFGYHLGLASEDTRKTVPIRESFTPNDAGQAAFAEQIARLTGKAVKGPNTGATASGLPGGGQGVWGYPLSGTEEVLAAGARPLWHRTDKPVLMDARGVLDPEIQASLKKAWDMGHDAVMLKNL